MERVSYDRMPETETRRLNCGFFGHPSARLSKPRSSQIAVPDYAIVDVWTIRSASAIPSKLHQLAASANSTMLSPHSISVIVRR